MRTEIDELVQQQLSRYFPEDEVDVRVGPTGNGYGMPLFYIPARRVQQRLDNVVGPMNWKVEFDEPVNRTKQEPAGAECTIYIRRTDGEWVGKSDVSPNTDTEGMKGGYSKAMVRAAVQWGIGRYLYFLGDLNWVETEEKYGRTQFAEQPRLPKEYLPVNENKPEYTQEEVRRMREASDGVDSELVSKTFSEHQKEAGSGEKIDVDSFVETIKEKAGE
jgi:hypothetical protein